MRQCIFCGEPANSKEDVWPLWFIKEAGVQGSGQMTAERNGCRTASWRTATTKLPARVVCAECNNNWMSRLECAAKACITPLLVDDTKSEITAQAQATIAAWVVKTSMVLEALRTNGPTTFHSSEMRGMREWKKIPSPFGVWIAKVVGFHGASSEASVLRGKGVEHGEAVTAYLTTGHIGEFAFQSVIIRRQGKRPSQPIFPAIDSSEWDETALAIWPPNLTSLSWPAKRGLDGEIGIMAFHKRWCLASSEVSSTYPSSPLWDA